MKTFKIMMFMFFLIIFSFAASAVTFTYDDVYKADSFGYSDDFINHGWGYVSTLTSATNPTTDQVTESLAFGENKTNSGATFSRYIYYNFPVNVTERTLLFEADVDIVNASYVQGANIIRFNFYDTPNNRLITQIIYNENGGFNFSTSSLNLNGFEDCTYQMTYGIPYGSWNFKIAISVSSENSYYFVWIDDNLICSYKNYSYKPDSTVGNIMAVYLENSLYTNKIFRGWIDNVIFGEGRVSGETLECDYPIIFCDRFNYDSPLYFKEANKWNTYIGDGSIDEFFSPVSNALSLNYPYYIRPEHVIPKFQTDYAQDENYIVSESYYSPIYSSEFKLKLFNGSAQYNAKDIDHRNILTINFNNTGAYPTTTNESNVVISDLSDQAYHDVKINYYFAQNSAQLFNSTVTSNYADIYIDDIKVNIDPVYYTDNASVNLYRLDFTKKETDNFTIDDYFVMVGTDREVPNIDDYYNPFYSSVNQTITAGSEDMADSITGLWSQMGLRSQLSRIITSLFLMLLLAGAVLGAMMKTGTTHIGALVVIEVIFMFVLMAIGLFPVWLLTTIGIMSIAIGALTFAKSVRGG